MTVKITTRFRRPWYGKVYGAYGDGDPSALMLHVQRGGVVAPTPTNQGITVARLSFFMLPQAITVNRIRYYSVGTVGAGTYDVAIYRWSDKARVTAQLGFSTTANTWGSVSAGGVGLDANTIYFIACGVQAVGVTAGPVAFGTTITATTGQIQTAPASLPGNLDADAGVYAGYLAQMTVVAGALPDPAVAGNIVAQAAWTGGCQAFWIDNDSAA